MENTINSSIDLNLKLLQRLQGEDGVTEISNLTQNLGGLEVYEDAIKRDEDLYFISFAPNENRYVDAQILNHNPRSKNDHIDSIRYYKADFDVRSYIFEHEDGRVISDEELDGYIEEILVGLKQDDLLGTFNCVVHSGNGIHVYWIGKHTQSDAKAYAIESAELYRNIKKLFPDKPHLWPDFACGNIGRLLRLPGSTNYKTKYGLPPHEVKIIYYSEEDSILTSVYDVAGEAILEEETKRIERLKTAMNRRCCNKIKRFKQNDLFHKINEEINIAELVCEYTGWQVGVDGINFISNRDGKNTGAYLIPEENIVVHMGTPHLSNYFRVYSPYAFILVHYADGDAGKAFDIAKEMYPELKQKGRFYFEKKNKDDGKN